MSSDPADGLRSLIDHLVSLAYTRWDKDVRLTCVYRTKAEDAALYRDPQHSPGLHTIWRAADVSVKGFSWAEVRELVMAGNEKWEYDGERPWMKCFLFERGDDPGSSGAHIHVQVHPQTRRRPTEASG